MTEHRAEQPSAWVTRWAELLGPGGRVLDVACGRGRHARWLAQAGFQVDAIDRDAAALSTLEGLPQITTYCADIEGGQWPLPSGVYSGVIVTNYLHRPLFPVLLDALGEAGVLIYETFARGNERFGRPSNPNFLLARGELLDQVRTRLQVVAYEDLEVREPRPACVQRICARREPLM